MDSKNFYKICQKCGVELVFIEPEIVVRIKELLRPNFSSLGVALTVNAKKYHPICPSCDNYALGLDLIEAFPVLTQSGTITTVHELEKS